MSDGHLSAKTSLAKGQSTLFEKLQHPISNQSQVKPTISCFDSEFWD